MEQVLRNDTESLYNISHYYRIPIFHYQLQFISSMAHFWKMENKYEYWFSPSIAFQRAEVQSIDPVLRWPQVRAFPFQMLFCVRMEFQLIRQILDSHSVWLCPESSQKLAISGHNVVNIYSFSVINRIPTKHIWLIFQHTRKVLLLPNALNKQYLICFLLFVTLNSLNFFTSDLFLQARCISIQSDCIYICLIFSAWLFQALDTDFMLPTSALFMLCSQMPFYMT